MGLSASLWTSVSGLITHGERMNVVGNNLANVNTIGFKSQRMDFNDYLYVGKGSASGPTQIGEGVGVYAVLGDFSQGSFESTNSVTDIAIDGNGFFKVRQKGTGKNFYTRAGDFYFNTDRELQNPEGYILQGWKVNNKKSVSFGTGTAVRTGNAESPYVGYGTPRDIQLDSWNLIPQRTTNVSVANNLVNSEEYDKTTSNTNPLTALYNLWDANSEPPVADEAYATQSSVDVYDEGGSKHTLTIYMDKVNTPKYDENGTLLYKVDGLPAGYSIYEYLVTIPPSEDNRSYGGTYDPATGKLTGETKFYMDPTTGNTLKNAGVLMTGVMIFNGSGQLVDQTAYTYAAQDSPAANSQSSLDPDAMASWQPTRFSSTGLPVFTGNFTGQPLANSVSETMLNPGSSTPHSQAQDYLIELDFGLTNANNSWTDTTKSLADLTVSGTLVDYSNLARMDKGAERDDDATANNGTTFITDMQADGYSSGVLSNCNIDDNGVVYGIYNNGVSLPLYQISLYDFHNNQGLYREGGNLFSATKESGAPREGVPGDGVFGSTKAYNIENSNVDMSTEFVRMIATQRGFQANSKGVTTVDTMLETVIGMKR